MTIDIQFYTQADTQHDLFTHDSLATMYKRFEKVTAKKSIGFFDLNNIQSHYEKTLKAYEKFKHKRYFIQIGIGGSALGPQMLVSALGKRATGVQILFIDNTDSELISDVFEEIKSPKDSLFYVVSKSGSTAETLAGLALAKNFLLKSGIKESELKDYFVFCTDKANGELRAYSDQNNFTSLEVPSDLGGRFSVLSPVGFFPALFAGIEVEKLISGAVALRDNIKNQKHNHALFTTGAHLFFLHSYFDHVSSIQVGQTVLMPYSSKLKLLSHWFVQLWGESLGKYSATKRTGVGLTPLAAYGATDQHSQMQLFMEGPNDKVIFLLEIEERDQNYSLDAGLPLNASQKLSSYTLNQVIKAQFDGTLKALKERKRNVIHLKIKRNNPESLGALIMYFECLTALMGEYLEVDAFNQPGVELGKKFAFEYLKNL